MTAQITSLFKLVEDEHIHRIYVYTDGACSNNGRANAKAGLGVYFGENDARNMSKRVEGKQTNNTAELSAIIEVFNICKDDIENDKKIIIYSDSTYSIRCCGEYGEKYSRPHYHACIFNHDFEDKELWTTKQGTKLYISEELQSIWPKGFSTIGDVTFDSAAYVARYILKKQNSNTNINISDDAYNNAILADGKYYSKFSKEHGLMSHPIQPEYTTMSRGNRLSGQNGIAYDWYQKFKKEVYPDDFIVIDGRKMPPPKYYEYLYELDDNNVRILKKRRKTLSIRRKADNTYDRLKTREICVKAKINLKKRNLEEI